MDLQTQPPLPRKRDFRIGILGSGFVVNECHLPAYRKAGFNPVAIASRDRRKAEQTAQRHGIPKVHDSCEALLDDPSIEVLDIAVPPQAQLALIKQACARQTVQGILAQKPLGINYMEAVTAAMECKRAGIVLSVNQNMRYDQSVRAAKTLLQNGVIGQPVFATIEMRGIPHWMPWQAELGWATLRVMSIHHLDCFRYWFGGPEGIYCSVRTDPRAKFPHADGICAYILDYASGLRCVGIDDPWTGPAKEGCPSDIYLRWRIEGLNGLAIGDIGWCRDPCTTPSTIKYAKKGDSGFHEPIWTESWFPDAFIGTMAQLLIALETGTEPAISAADNLKTMALVEAAYTSAERFASVSLSEIKPSSHIVRAETKKPGFFSRLFSKPAVRPEPEAMNNFTQPAVRPETEAMSNFTPRAQQALALARKEAEQFNHNFVGTEHVLLGLIALSQGTAVTVLRKLGLDLNTVRAEVEKQVGTGPDQKVFYKIPYTPRVKKVLALAAKEARNLNHTYIGTEHILLGLLREGDGVAARVLKDLDINIEQTCREILKELDPSGGEGRRNPVEAESKELGTLSHSSLTVKPSAEPPVPEEQMFNLTPRAQQVLALARAEADGFNHQFVGTEHVLLGVIALGSGVAANVLLDLGLDLAKVRGEVQKQVCTGPDQKMIGDIPYTPGVKRVLVLAAEEAKRLAHSYVGTEHILLGVLREADGVAGRVLKNLGVDLDKTRAEILKELDPKTGEVPQKLAQTKIAASLKELERKIKEIRGKHPAIEMKKRGFFSRLLAKLTGNAGLAVFQEPISNFTPRAQQALALARKEADRFNHNFVGTEHVLLGLIALDQGVAVTVLKKLGLELAAVRAEIEKQVGTGPEQKMTGNIPYTPRVKKVLALAAKEARNLNHTYVGTEHILLGLLREGDGVAARVLRNLNVDIEQTRLEILKELDPNFGK